MRPRGFPLLIASTGMPKRSASVSRTSLPPCVLTLPGVTVLTRIPAGPSSFARPAP